LRRGAGVRESLVVTLLRHRLSGRPRLFSQERLRQELQPALTPGATAEQVEDDAAPVGRLQPAGEEALDLSLPEMNHGKHLPTKHKSRQRYKIISHEETSGREFREQSGPLLPVRSCRG